MVVFLWSYAIAGRLVQVGQSRLLVHWAQSLRAISLVLDIRGRLTLVASHGLRHCSSRACWHPLVSCSYYDSAKIDCCG